jgi:NTE family protein
VNTYSTFGGLVSAFKWVFLRLPWPFSAAFALISLWWAVHGFYYADQYVAAPMRNVIGSLLGRTPADFHVFLFDTLHIAALDRFIDATVTLLCFILGFVVAYNLAALTNWLFAKSVPRQLEYHAGFFPSSHDEGAPLPPFSASTRIGIVLAGGGAKGAYQAGAMKAIYKFLEERKALGNVKVISGTSIGSWNAMFWLAGMIKSPKGWSEPGCHEWWWKRLSAKTLVAPTWYVPFYRNAFLSSAPWQDQFEQMFGSEAAKQRLFGTDIHFYMTRSNVRTGGLECATNNLNPKPVNRVRYDKIKVPADLERFFARTKTAVFASMDLPPLFPYMECNGELYEDGGVIDNLPIAFPAAEGCDLIFVLPLNSDFEQEPDNKSLVLRLNRVMDVQQGALERHGFKLLYLYNENAALRNRIAELSPGETAPVAIDAPEVEKASRLQSLRYALQRTHRQIRVFAVCPDKSFVQSTINTRDLWNTRGAATAFDVMFDTTSELLDDFDFEGPQKTAGVALIKRGRTSTIDHEF